MQANQDAYIVSSVRTASGKGKRGALKNVRPETMGSAVVQAALGRVEGLDADRVDDVIVGCAFPEGPQGMNMGRIIAQKAGLPNHVPGATVNRFCSSGLQTIAQAAQAIATGTAEVVVAGGTESMSQVPMSGFFFQPDPDLVDDMPDTYISMGMTAENVAERYDVDRETQDAFALQSHERAVAATEEGRFDDEIVPLTFTETRVEEDERVTHEQTFATDEGPRPDTSLEALQGLSPAFKRGGTVTAGNAAPFTDGAAASVLVSERVLSDLGADPMGRLVSFAVAGVDPDVMGIGPVAAVPKALRQAGLDLDDIALVELNEAFAAQSVAVIRELGLDEERVNVNGGAIALGHPLGATGAKLTATLLHELRRRGQRYGLVTMCVGGGMGAAGVVENLQA
jgi:acetyl-CoA acyltransferase